MFQPLVKGAAACRFAYRTSNPRANCEAVLAVLIGACGLERQSGVRLAKLLNLREDLSSPAALAGAGLLDFGKSKHRTPGSESLAPDPLILWENEYRELVNLHQTHDVLNRSPGDPCCITRRNQIIFGDIDLDGLANKFQHAYHPVMVVSSISLLVVVNTSSILQGNNKTARSAHTPRANVQRSDPNER